MKKIYKIETNVLEQLIINAKDWLSPQRGANQKIATPILIIMIIARLSFSYCFHFYYLSICAIFHNVFSLLCKLLTKFYRR